VVADTRLPVGFVDLRVGREQRAPGRVGVGAGARRPVGREHAPTCRPRDGYLEGAGFFSGRASGGAAVVG